MEEEKVFYTATEIMEKWEPICGETRHFEISHADKYGLAESVMIYYFIFCINMNRDDNKHQHDGRTWTNKTVKTFAVVFSFWTEKQVRRIIKSLTDKQVLLIGNYNKKGYDHTKWYAFKDEDLFLNPSFAQSKETNKGGKIQL